MKISQIGFTDNDFLLIREVRKVVFFAEMGIPESEIFDNLDEESDHFIFIEKNRVIGSVRLRHIENYIKLERMVIYREFRLQSFGYDAIKQIIDHYKRKKITKIVLDSIYDIRDFYKKCGFIEVGIVFDRVGFPHITMELSF